MIDICYVGNSSFDNIKTKTGFRKVIGGSAIYCSFASRQVTNKTIAVISNVNKEIKKLLDLKKIIHIGNVLPEINEFLIDETKGTCSFLKENDRKIIINQPIEINNLHISFRKGVDIDNILLNDNIKFNSLSIDVMIHSAKEFIPYLIKFRDKINTLFCNLKEYTLIKGYVDKINNIIITNEDKPVILIENDNSYFYEITPSKSVISTTGAGDSFIGGFLGSFCEKKDINMSINFGIHIANYSLLDYGPVNYSTKKEQFIVQKKLPKNIIVVGNSCAGKTTFINLFTQIFNIYSCIDDINPLLEMFLIDDISNSGDLNNLLKLKNNIKYMNNIYENYIEDFPNIEHFSLKANNDNGHIIVKPVLWNIILNKAVQVDKGKFNIIQFSRGKDELYEREFGKDVYKISIKEVIKAIGESEDIIIINLVSDFDLRKERNHFRFQNGGHFVAESTMDNVYNCDMFSYEHTGLNTGYITIDAKSYPVFTIINNKQMSTFELNNFFKYNIVAMLKYFNI